MFPSLRKLVWLDSEPGTESLILLFLHNRLSDVSLLLVAWDVPMILDYLTYRCPGLESLNFETVDVPHQGFDWTPARVACARVVDTLPLLRRLVLPRALLNADVVHRLSLHPCLQRICVTLFTLKDTHESGIASHHDSSPAHPFANLLALSIDSKNLLEFTDPLLKSPCLTTINVDVFDQSDLSTLIRLISTSSPGVKNLSVQTAQYPVFGRAFPLPINLALLLPLLRLESLQTLVIDHPVPPELDDDELGTLSAALPALVHFQLCVRTHCGADYKVPTLGCLIHFARNCRKLVSIGVYMDASVVPRVSRQDKNAFAPCLEVLEVCCSKITSHRRVADFLAAILPPRATINVATRSSRLQYVGADTDDVFDPASAMLYVDEQLREYHSEWCSTGDLLDNLESVRELLA